MNLALKFARSSELQSKFNLKTLEDQKFHWERLRDYFLRWLGEDETTETIAVEKGFSWLLFEDRDVRYILEGKIDHVAIRQGLGLIVEDHKTQSRADSRYPYNHQVCNYFAFVKPEYFVYNYIGLQDKLPKEGLRREIFKPAPGFIEQWKRDVKNTFDEMAGFLALRERLHIEAFPRRRSACKSQYGVCSYYKICQTPDDSKWVPTVLSAYKEKENKWIAWKKDE